MRTTIKDARDQSRNGGRALRALVVALGISSLSSAVGCESNRAEDTSLDRYVHPPRLDSASVLPTSSPPIPTPGPLVMLANQTKHPMKRAIAFAEGTTLHVIAAESDALECDGNHYPKAAWLEFRYDPGPLGDYYANEPTPVTVNFSLVGDTTDWRQAPPNWARAEITSLTSDNPTVKLEVKRTLGSPDPKTPTTVTISGDMELTVCSSALDLLVHAHPVVVDDGPARATFGNVSFTIHSALLFESDDPKNGLTATSLGLYEAPRVSCAAAKRPIGDDGGGVEGRQVNVDLVPLGAARKPAAVPSPITLDATEVTTGGPYYAVTAFNLKSLTGFIQFTAVDLSDDPLGGTAPPVAPPPRASGARGFIYAESPEGVVNGAFEASICKR